MHLSVDFIVPRYFFLNWVISVMGRSSQLNVSCVFVLLYIQYMEKKTFATRYHVLPLSLCNKNTYFAYLSFINDLLPFASAFQVSNLF